ncbi:unnamed protein product [Malus baccata var. baccata]
MVAMMGWGGVGEQGWRKGPWTPEEDKLLSEYVTLHGEGRWSSVSRSTGLNRNGKSCRLRWVNYMRPGLKRGHITPQEEGIIIELHALWGNKWSTIARYLPGRTDNEIKNFWRTHFKKKEKCTQKQEKRKAEILKAKQQQLEEDQNTKARATAPHDHWEACSQGTISNMNNIDIHETQATWQENMEEDKYCLPKLMHQASVEFWSDLLGAEGFYKLWNLDDVSGRMDPQHCSNTRLSQCNKAAMQINN